MADEADIEGQITVGRVRFGLRALSGSNVAYYTSD